MYYQQNYQNGGFVRVRNEDEARNYPIAPGYSVTFVDEDGAHCYTKTASFSQFEPPKFEKYRLIKEDTQNNSGLPESDKNTLKQLNNEIEGLKCEISALREKINEYTSDI